MLSILVTGGAGFIGSALIKKLSKEGHRVVSIDDYSIGTSSNHVEGVKYIKADIELIKEFKNQYDIIFHLAALSRIQPSYNNPSETFRVNSIGTQAVCEFARLNDSKIIYSGSSSKWHDPYGSPYAGFKHIGEQICKTYKYSFDTNIEIVRSYNVYGPGEITNGDWAAVIGKWRGCIEQGLPLPIVGDGKQRRDFTYIEDIVDGLYRIAMSNESHDDAWELGTGKNYSVLEVYNMFKQKFNCEAKFTLNQNGNYKETLQKNKDAQTRLGWAPKDRLKEYISTL